MAKVQVQVQVQQITNKLIELFGDHIDLSDVTQHNDQVRNDHLITRALAAYAVYWKTGCSIEEAAKSITDGTNDNGIDALYYNKNNKRITIVQSKYIKNGNSEPESSEIRTFRDGVFDLIEDRLHKFNNKIQSRTDIIEKIKQFGTKLDIVLVYTSKEDLAEPANQLIQEMLIDLNGDDDDDGLFTFHKLHKKLIVSTLTSSIDSMSIDLEFLLKDYGLTKEPLTSFYGKIDGLKLKEWWEKHNDLLFRDNIRKSLGDTSVNLQLSKTIAEDPEYFWFYNNGITLIADNIEKTAENGNKRDFGFFKASNASIVNGAQTYSTIGKNGLRGLDIEKIEVNFRVIQVDHSQEEIKNNITKYNNTQNTILPKDFLSQNEIQINIQTQLALSGYNYVIKRDSDFTSNDITFDFDEVCESLIMISDKPNLAAVYKKEIGRFYNTDSNIYKSLFNESTNPYRIINAVKLNRTLKAKLNQAIDKTVIRRLDLPKIDKIARSSNILLLQCLIKYLEPNIKKTLDEKECSIDFSVDRISEILEDICIVVHYDFPTKYYVTLFQNVQKVGSIYNKV